MAASKHRAATRLTTLAKQVGVPIRALASWIDAGCPTTSAAAVKRWRGGHLERATVIRLMA